MGSFLRENQEALREAGIVVESGGPGRVRIRLKSIGYDKTAEDESAYLLLAHRLPPERTVQAFAQLPATEEAVAKIKPVNQEDRFWILNELLDEQEMLNDLPQGFGPLRSSRAEKNLDETTRNLLAVLDEKDSRAELMARERAERYHLDQLSGYANEPWLKFTPTLVQDLQATKLARLRLALELDRLLKGGKAEIVEVFPQGRAFNDKFFSRPDQARPFSEDLPVFKIRVLPGKKLRLSRSWGGESRELGSWLLPEEGEYFPPAMMREKFATPIVNTHEHSTVFEFSQGETFYLGGIGAIRAPGQSLHLQLGDFNYGIGGRGGTVQYWYGPGQTKISSRQIVESYPRIVTSEALWELRRKLATAGSLQELESSYETFLARALSRFQHPDTDLDTAIRDLPENFLRSFLHDLLLLRKTAEKRAEGLGGHLSDHLVHRAEGLDQLLKNKFSLWHSHDGIYREYNPAEDNVLPGKFLGESRELTGF
jgi:hypothetical protein